MSNAFASSAKNAFVASPFNARNVDVSTIPPGQCILRTIALQHLSMGFSADGGTSGCVGDRYKRITTTFRFVSGVQSTYVHCIGDIENITVPRDPNGNEDGSGTIVPSLLIDMSLLEQYCIAYLLGQDWVGPFTQSSTGQPLNGNILRYPCFDEMGNYTNDLYPGTFHTGGVGNTNSDGLCPGLAVLPYAAAIRRVLPGPGVRSDQHARYVYVSATKFVTSQPYSTAFEPWDPCTNVPKSGLTNFQTFTPSGLTTITLEPPSNYGVIYLTGGGPSG